MIIAKNIIGKNFGRLIVLYQTRYIAKHHSYYFMVKCECGTFKEICKSNLMNGTTQSCGCLLNQRRKESHTTHGKSGSKVYRSWYHMIGRCENPNDKSYPNYGGRGITVSDEFRQSFQTFYEHIGDPPSSEYTLGRIDNSRGYERDNVEWQTIHEQGNNKRNNILLDIDGIKITLAQASIKYNINRDALRRRIIDLKWSHDKAAKMPLKKLKLFID